MESEQASTPKRMCGPNAGGSRWSRGLNSPGASSNPSVSALSEGQINELVRGNAEGVQRHEERAARRNEWMQAKAGTFWKKGDWEDNYEDLPEECTLKLEGIPWNIKHEELIDPPVGVDIVASAEVTAADLGLDLTDDGDGIEVELAKVEAEDLHEKKGDLAIKKEDTSR